MLYALNYYHVICQLHLDKTDGGEENKLRYDLAKNKEIKRTNTDITG